MVEHSARHSVRNSRDWSGSSSQTRKPFEGGTPFALHQRGSGLSMKPIDKNDDLENEAQARLAQDRVPQPRRSSAKRKARGGLLRLLQRVRTVYPSLGTFGSVNAYSKQRDLLSTAVCAHLRTTTDPFYAMEPAPVTNYGGRGGSQQLWWCGSVSGWRGSEPNVHALRGKRIRGHSKMSGSSAAKQLRYELQMKTSPGSL